MNQHLQAILDMVQRDEKLTAEQKAAIVASLKLAEKELEITAFKLERTEKVKRTTAILLEETIEELEQKRKAIETQNRELQIEASLERVRSTAMSMHSSDELGKVVSVVLNNLHDLGFVAEKGSAAHLIIFNSETRDFVQWSADPFLDHPVRARIPYAALTILSDFFEEKEKGLKFFTKVYPREQKNEFFEYAFEHSDLKHLPDGLKELILASETYTHWMAIEENSAISVNSMTGGQLSENQIDILKRFVRVFEQAYIRFLDLQKAEAQTRESNIELALERVRARTMAMRKSDELGDVATVLFKELNKLVKNLWSCGFVLCERDRGEDEWWLSTGDGFIPAFFLPNKGDVTHANIYNAWRKGKTYHTEQLEGDALAGHYKWLMSIPVSRKIFEDMFAAGQKLPEWQKLHCAYFSYGYLVMITEVPCPEEEIFKRFARVFDQTYTRFLDLQKAEAQARESQIQLSLERVRARTMAMQKSDELPQASNLLFQQVQSLGMPAWSAGYCIWGKNKESITLWMSSEGVLQPPFKAPTTEDHLFKEMRVGQEIGKNFHVVEMGGDDLVRHYEYMRTLPVVGDILDSVIEAGHTLPTFQIMHYAYFSQGLLLFITYEPVPWAHDIFRRFANVFDQTYTRFLDLQKAEAQGREAQIELALERVRARTMAMQHSEELSETAAVLFDQFNLLGEEPERIAIEIVNEEDHVFEVWATQHGGSRLDQQIKISLDEPHVMQKMYKAWKAQKKSITIDLHGKELEEYFQYLSNSGLPVKREVFGKRRIQNVATFSKGILTIITPEPRPPETIQLLERFASVFDGTYTRFLDLQKAESQAREAQIELALEKVRARAMAMQNSEELKELIGTVFTELTKLDLVLTRCVIMIYDAKENSSRWWMANSEDPNNPAGFFIKPHEHPPAVAYFKAWRERKLKFTYALQGKEKQDWDAFLFGETELKNLPGFVIEGMKAPDLVYLNASFNNFGNLTLASLEQLNDEHFDILLRFAKVFDLTYTRFNDLQKAEVQAREAKIEASLERIRGKAMAMHRSEEIDEVLEVLFDQFDVLGIIPMSTHLTLIDVESNTFTFRETGKGGRKSFGEQKVSIDSMDIWKEAADKWKAMQPLSLNKLHFPKESLPLVWQVFHESFASMPEGHKITPEDYPDGIYHTAGNCKFGYIGMNQVRPATEEEEQIVLKFAVEFGRLYQRYLDLQKAEAQTKEAKIEAALERVRSSSLAMHKSEELKNVVKVVFENLESLGIKNINSVNINILHPDTKDFDLWLAAPGQDYSRNFRLPYLDHPIANDFFEAVKNGESLHRKIYGYEVKNKYFGYMFEHSDNKHLPEERKKLILSGPAYAVSAAITRYSSIFIHNYSGIPFSDEENNILLRFARVFDQTYTRFLDLQKVEAQTREAMIEASLERVRSKAMAMHSSQDLAETIAAFYNELESFSITPRRCGVGLLNKETRIAELSTMNTTRDGNSIEIIGTLKMEGHPVLEGVYENWLLKKEYHPVLRGAEIAAYYRLVRPQIPFPDYPNDAVQYGYFFFFPEGGVYAWTEKQMEEEELIIYRRFTSVLSLTYKRYKDLQQAEELAKQATEDLINLKIEKKRTEDALTELRNTQSQLVQAEKMASLGELTAGIAHEIQNPLNFVNNFSEVSRELLEEMNEQLAIGNKQEATEIADDIKQNLEKILHHGKRADSIVKGMLQHSRSSSGQKELTDINILADEYLRLAFHGLRAKDKSFNADLKTEFDNNLDKIAIVPQEIGRVLVNLLNNAFYAVSEKRKKQMNGYEPVVTLSTKKAGKRIEIAVKDNGNGIPKESLDKIFQPFFTTKPTGQGTGLGLSLSYDIIKAHGGDLKVETQEGEGSKFILQLPAT